MYVKIGPYCEWDVENQKHVPEEREIVVQIDNYDTWNMDRTLSMIILPMLKQLKATKHGSALVDDEDVPEGIRSTNAPDFEQWETDIFVHDRWNWVMDEMIWAFEQHVDDESEEQFYTHYPFNPDTATGWKKDLEIGEMDVDREGLNAFHKRKQNGFRLFGVYFTGLWN